LVSNARRYRYFTCLIASIDSASAMATLQHTRPPARLAFWR
jgi:hypothetical protein